MINLYGSILPDAVYFKQLSVKELLFAYCQCPQIVRWVDLWAHYNHFIYTISGDRLLQSPEQCLLLQEGDLIFLRKDTFCQGQFYDEAWKVIVFCIPDHYLQQLYKEYRPQLKPDMLPPPTKDRILRLSTNDTTRAFFYSIMPYFAQQPPAPENLLELKFRELIYNILSNANNACMLSLLNSLCDNTLPSLIEVMESHYTYNLSLTEYARICHRSLTAFKKEFAETYDTTPGRWLLIKRLDYAKLLLRTSRKRINEVVAESGFESTTHFSRVFRQRFGISPLQYRKQRI